MRRDQGGKIRCGKEKGTERKDTGQPGKEKDDEAMIMEGYICWRGMLRVREGGRGEGWREKDSLRRMKDTEQAGRKEEEE